MYDYYYSFRLNECTSENEKERFREGKHSIWFHYMENKRSQAVITTIVILFVQREVTKEEEDEAGKNKPRKLCCSLERERQLIMLFAWERKENETKTYRFLWMAIDFDL